MKTKTIETDRNWSGGITLRDSTFPEENNMALHACISPSDVLTNRADLLNSLGRRAQDMVCANQTHSANFYKVTAADRGRGALSQADAIPDTDALYTTEPDIVLAGFMADCVPVILVNEEAGIAAVVHSGWQGTVKEITPKLLCHLIGNEQCRPEAFHVYIGPALSQGKFEVDRDVRDRFQALGYAEDFIEYNEATGKYHIDNKLTVKTQCERAGIPSGCITVDPMCTYLSEDGFSYRQDKQAGRHLAYVMLK
ncbi:peptidoglycan editing factor PgeF [Sporosarcina sp. NCCP-2716]|uniref:peptidoglycan editing factor PgeF n=1 Tax=Sporosarcina sp. NCCP-2716 TaxID=2943679 RepID=UPI00203F4A59|nr:peptidoglycan editing factor PgeF [Sporosarcina sp. NCCP-2716]